MSLPPARNNLAFIIDLDDTILATGDLYFRVREEFVAAVAQHGSDPDTVREAFEHIEADNIRDHGHRPDRYARSMVDTVKKILGEHDSKNLLQRVHTIGLQVGTQKPPLVDGATSLLKALKDRGPVFLITRGDNETQEAKIKFHGLDKLVHGYRIADRKSRETYLTACDEWSLNPAQSWVIGDSISADVNPALECGFKVIHTAYPSRDYTWIQDSAEPSSWKFFHVASLSEIPRLVDWDARYNLLKVAQQTLDKARDAYAPYSHFNVGACAITAKGDYFFGVNVENASLGLTIDAEQLALAQAVSNKSGPVEALVVAATAVPNSPYPITPCGKCRQWCVELMPPGAPVASVSPTGIKIKTVRELLPEAFETYATK